MAKQTLTVIRGTVIQDGKRYTAGSDNDTLEAEKDEAERLTALGVCEPAETKRSNRGGTGSAPRNPGTPPSGDTAA